MTEFIFEYPEKLQPVFDFKGRYVVLGGGRSSSKSHFVARKILLKTLASKRDIICLREFQANLKQSNYKLFYNLITQYKLPFKVYADHFVSRTTGSEIIFKGMNDLTADGIKSYEGFSDAWVEEAQSFSTNSFQKLDPTIRQEDSVIYITLNPEAEEGDPVVNEIKEKYTDKSLFIHINYDENPFCPQSIIEMAEACRRTKPDEFNHIWLGQPRNRAKNKVVKYFSKDNIIPLHYQNDLDIHLCCDFNVVAMSWALMHKEDDKFFFFDEIALEDGNDVKDASREFINRYQGHKGKVILNGDASGNNRSANNKKPSWTIIAELLTQAGFSVEWEIDTSNGSVQHRIDSFNEMIFGLDGERRIFFDPSCVNSIESCKISRYNDKGKVEEPSLTQLKNGANKWARHYLDAISYPAVYYYPLGFE